MTFIGKIFSRDLFPSLLHVGAITELRKEAKGPSDWVLVVWEMLA